jgi:hypothetical protein
MNDNLLTPTRIIAVSRFSIWLPFVALALSAAAFRFDLPARLARVLHRTPTHAYFKADTDIHDDPAQLWPINDRTVAMAR